MSWINTIAHREVYPLLDCTYVQRAIHEPVYITFACTPQNDEIEASGILENGRPFIVIRLDYQTIKNTPPLEIRDIMLRIALQRLGEKGWLEE